MEGLAFAFWGSVALVAYTYVFYPGAIWILSMIWGRVNDVPVPEDRDLPSVSVLVVAHNEGPIISERISNLLRLDYPKERLELVIASDGSTDRTNESVREHPEQRVKLVELLVRSGKPSVLNQIVPSLRGDIVVLSDANTMMQPDAVRRLARWFSQPQIGVVCGEIILVDSPTGRNVDSLYWKYETFLKRCEGKLGALLGASGAMYAMRRSLFEPVPPNTVVEDLVIPLLARLRTGCLVLYDDSAIASEETPADISAEFQRRARIGAGGFQSIPVLWPLLDPRQGWISFTFLSHKLLRWFCPFFLVAAAAANVLLSGAGTIYQACLAIQIIVYCTALAGRWFTRSSTFTRAARLATMFTAMNAALLVGFLRWVTGRQQAAWQRTAR